MTAYWIRFENWLTQHAPALSTVLLPGAAAAEIEKLESVIGKKLPEDFVQFYMVHNGQLEEDNWEGLIDTEQLITIDTIIDNVKRGREWIDNRDQEDEDGPVCSDPDEGIKDHWWNPYWIPFTFDGFGNCICIDLDPAPGGHYGQVIRMLQDDPERELYAPSFEEFIAHYIADLEAGKYVYEKGMGLMQKDILSQQ